MAGLALFSVSRLAVWADEYDDLQKEKEQVEQEKQAKEEEAAKVEEQKGTLGEQLAASNNQLAAIGSQLSAIGGQLTAKRLEIEGLEKQKAGKEEELSRRERARSQLIRGLYKRSRLDPLELLFGRRGFSQFTRRLAIYKATILEAKREVALASQQVSQLRQELEQAQKKKRELESQLSKLNRQKQDLQRRQNFVNQRLSELSAYREELLDEIAGLSSQIANITTKQEELIRQKLSATAQFTSVGDVAPVIVALPNPPFSPAFAVFSRGYPHRVGMNQYGAFGRAKVGQSAEEILKTYYKGVEIQEYPVPQKIKIQTGGGEIREIEFEGNYLKGIAEMPSVWADEGGFEALKAQAIAARTYALATTGGGAGAICVSQRCQVYLESKVGNPQAKEWHRAVEETRGKVITHNGAPIKAWYSSTSGGFTRLATDFDVRWGSSPDYIRRLKDYDADNNAYDGSKWGGSPWFYKAWFDPESDKHPWLTEEEMEDLLNAALLPESYNRYLSQEEPVVSSEPGWSKAKVKEALGREETTPIGRIKEIRAVDTEEGYTQNIWVVSENYPDGKAVDGKRFREIFVMRSRGHLALWSSLYDIVRRD